ncbi:uncharacterized protein LOC130181794 isoform X2 [Seriola aureovittata]|uniref:uncharacterized protein LOC130181794 isoform X2 n=1 Tax=Seriola aureovittata TaxID=2871759 RepID=UPI0024BE643A|nr:uncharacterized protein LOC130181794 isoform X2 [Seriola aureovittata]
MSGTQLLRVLVNERLAAAAEEIFGLFEKTIAEYQDEVVRSKREIVHLTQQTPSQPVRKHFLHSSQTRFPLWRRMKPIALRRLKRSSWISLLSQTRRLILLRM